VPRPGFASIVWFLAFVGVSFLYVRNFIDTTPRPAPLLQDHADDYYLCKSAVLTGWPEFSLVLKYTGSAASEILFEGRQYGRFDRYEIKEQVPHDDVYYWADEVSPDVPGAFETLRINRLSGEMETATRMSQEAMQLLVDVCDGKIPVNECGTKMTGIRGNATFECLKLSQSFASCNSRRSRDNIVDHFKYQCRRTERRF